MIGKNIDEVEQELNLAYYEWLKLDRRSLDEMDPKSLFGYPCGNEMNLDADHIEILAEFSMHEGEYYFNKNEFLKSKNKLEKALKLYSILSIWKDKFFLLKDKQLYKK